MCLEMFNYMTLYLITVLLGVEKSSLLTACHIYGIVSA
jgi:hypothetical protein